MTMATTQARITVRFDAKLLRAAVRRIAATCEALDALAFYRGGWRHPPLQITKGEDILCGDPACVSRRWKHSHPEGWPEHPSYKGS